MDQLPCEVRLKIFGYLDLHELMSLRLVCKKMNDMVKEVKIKKLAFITSKKFWKPDELEKHKFGPGRETWCTREMWFSTKELKEFRDFFNFSKYFLVSSPLSGGPFDVRFLRCLSIESLSNLKGICLEDLNRLQYLEHLEVGFDLQPCKSSSMWSLFDKQPRKVARLCLPNLRVLSMVSYYNQKGLEIDAPKLRALKLPGPIKLEDTSEYVLNYPMINENDLLIMRLRMRLHTFSRKQTNDFSTIEFKHPGSIKSLWMSTTFSSDVPNFIRKLKNVEYLIVENVYLSHSNFTLKLESVFLIFPKLKQLKFNCGTLRTFESSKFPNFLDELAVLKRPDQKVYYMDIELSNDPKLIHDFNFYYESLQNEPLAYKHVKAVLYKFILQLKNHLLLSEQIELFFSCKYVNYNELVDLLRTIPAPMQNWILPDEAAIENRKASPLISLFPVNFFDRYPVIFSIRTEIEDRPVEDEELFIFLVKSCKNVRRLSLKNSGLSQAFFDLLPAISNLNCLEIYEANELNMNFLFRMNQLIFCKTNQKLAPDLVLKLVKTNPFRILTCKIKTRSVAIRRRGMDEYEWEINLVRKMMNFNSLWQQVYRLENWSLRTYTLEFFEKAFLR